MIYVLYFALAVVVFIEMLNSFLRGSRKDQLDIIVNVLIFGLVVASFFVAGWKFGLVAIALRFIFAIVTRPLAARTASKMFLSMKKDEFRYWPSKGQDCKYIGLPPRSLSRISSELGRNIDELGRFNFDGLVKSRFCPFLSFPRRRESSYFNRFWIPAFTGMTVFRLFTTSSTLKKK
jgi:hypothetical protein